MTTDTKKLCYALARKIYRPEAIVAACDEAGIDYVYVSLSGSPHEVWFGLLRFASKALDPDGLSRAISVLWALVAEEAKRESGAADAVEAERSAIREEVVALYQGCGHRGNSAYGALLSVLSVIDERSKGAASR